jgi:1-deoxy-D-xylulose-5-phosphate synthase
LQKHATFIRYPRGLGEGVPIKDMPKVLDIGKGEVIENFKHNGGKRVAFFALGNMNSVARKGAEELRAEGYDVAHINPRFWKPLDGEVHEFFARAADLVITMEDHVLPGGYGSLVVEHLNDAGVHMPVLRIGWPDQFIEHASSVDYLRTKYGLTAAEAVKAVRTRFESEAVEAEPAKTFAVA